MGAQGVRAVTSSAGSAAPRAADLFGRCPGGAASEAFGHYLDGSEFSVEQARFVSLIVEELTANGVMDPGRLFESPYTDHAPTGPDFFFPDADVDVIVQILHDVKAHAVPTEVA
ncbi:hypothetical protein BH24ACT12_BH24ACT12_28690 [soil metagenome]